MGEDKVAKVLNQEVAGISLWDAAVIGAAKVVGEEVLSRTPYVGNGTARSAAVKVVGALVASYAMGKVGGTVGHYGKLAAAGVLIDGMEDGFVAARAWVQARRASVQSQTAEAVI